MHKLGYAEVEAWIVDEYDNVRLPPDDVLLAHPHVAHNGGQVQQNGHETHIGQFAIVLDTGAALSLHQVAAEEAEVGLRVA